MRGKRLRAPLLSYVPHLCKGIACTRDKHVVVNGVQAKAHDIAEMVGKVVYLGARLNVPQGASHVTGRGEDPAIVDEATAREIAGVAGQLTRDAGRAFAGGKVVDGADVVQTTASDVVATG